MIKLDNKELNINWLCATNPIVSERDLKLVSFKEYTEKMGEGNIIKNSECRIKNDGKMFLRLKFY